MLNISIIGAGFSGLSSAAYLAKAGHDVNVYETHGIAGGRARKFEDRGFVFDMGPSWYWMPDVMENFFKDFSVDINSLLTLKRLDPSYRLYFGKDDHLNMPADYTDLRIVFESIEKGSADALDKFLEEAEVKYAYGMNEFVQKPALKVSEFMSGKILRSIPKMHLLRSFSKHLNQYFKHPKIRQILSFPVLFLGATPQNTPALYSLMNYADIKLGTWYPMGGMYKLVEAMKLVAESQGANFHFNSAVKSISTNHGSVNGLLLNSQFVSTDVLIASADYHHVEQTLLPENDRSYSESYWDSRTMAPSCLIFYLGIDKKLSNIEHHNLFFDESFDDHARQIYDQPEWPDHPLFYVCCPSVTDHSVAPEGKENLFFLMPIGADLEDSEIIRERYFTMLVDRFESLTGNHIREHIEVKHSYCSHEFVSDYGAFKGNAYGLANTLRQTAFLKPKMRSKKLDNLFYTGQLTSPGPGVPPSIISGKTVATLVNQTMTSTLNTK
jgi:phytoene desaturase